MQLMRKALFATAIAASLIAGAHAAPIAQTLDVTWYKDGKVIDGGRHIVADGAGVSTYLHRSGQEVGYVTCQTTAQGKKLVPSSVFVGRSLLIKPVLIDLDKLQLSVSAIDTAFDGKRKTGNADCASEVVDTHGYAASDIPVELNGTQTVEVPMKDPHYRLVLSLHPEAI
jgi:hypothetical protein